jgi:hypothetical protein
MNRIVVGFVWLCVMAQLAAAKDDAKPRSAKAADAKVATAQASAGTKAISGMSILGNQEAPKSLVIVPWKSSRIGDPGEISRLLDDSTKPVDKEVFMRELSYYEIRSN